MHTTTRGPLRRVSPILAAAAGCLLSPTLLAQQFQYQTDLIPGPNRWTEGMEAADVDQDGDYDLFFADGNGFSSPSTQQQQKLIINQLVESGTGTVSFTDESLTRLGTFVSHGRQVVTADVDADGWVDALFPNAFNADIPWLFINRGDTQPGFFDEESAARGLGGPYSSASAGFGDIDNDGDLDLILSDSGNSFLGGAGERPHLFFNDGTGNFTENAAALNAPIKAAHMDVHLIDIDNDWDLDFFGPNRANNAGGNHYLMLNDGLGNFTDVSNLIPPTSASVYEAEVGDLDKDTDLDMFFVSSNGFQEGGIRNDFIENGTLGFTKGPVLGGADDNEISLIDYDMDGDLDALVGSLSNNSEKIHANNGSGLFSDVTGDFPVLSDSTLDCTVVDIDKDGAYDVVTAQGESNQAQWRNKYYRNTGAADTIAPEIQREETLTSPSATGPWVVRAVIYDQVVDDGKNWVTGSVSYRVNTTTALGAETEGETLPLMGNMYRFEMTDTAGGNGTALVYELTFVDENGNTTTSGQRAVSLQPCGFETYSVGAAPANVLTLAGTGTGAIGTSIDLVTTSAPATGVFTGTAIGRTNIPFGSGAILIDPATALPLAFNPTVGSTSTYTLPLPDNKNLVGIELDFQSFGVDAGVPGGLAFSNGLALVVCP